MATVRTGRDAGFSDLTDSIGLTDSTDFTVFAESAYASLLRTARLLTGDWHSAEDLVQSALVKVYLRWHRSAGWESRQAYARKVVVNLYATWRRRRWHGEVTGPGQPEGRPDPAAGDLIGGLDVRLELDRALAALSRAQRAVVVLRFYEDLSVDRTAELLGCSPGTVKSRTNRALERLRAMGALAGYAGSGASGPEAPGREVR
ncbi:SigE family RNA polymerase sigma factor [Streptomyces sp. LP05-1]|uniref:SigE family RNA polymerase sigma factor n=1 Tax=Streptomyces pyxinae TaxID=2970734 RepID=A0ABT2CPN5_9ACTN|nr:SigE family RNA polymerase sigma factor [Streptomyces sp. LP05-1]MCS0639401.1 SigE family RNA polymerase sigma factor [Streptomyces sp. LP05-1]